MENDIRALVLDSLLEIEKTDIFVNDIIHLVLDKYDYLDNKDKALYQTLTQGVVEKKITLDYVINQFSKTKVNKMKPLIRCLIRMGAYQILYLDKIPDSAACNEAVKLCKKRKFQNLSGFVNGILRSISRSKDSINYPSLEEDFVLGASVLYSMPEEIISLWDKEYGRKITTKLLEAGTDKRPLTVRIRQTASDADIAAFERALSDKGISYRKHPLSDRAYILKKIESVNRIPGYEEGFFCVQDMASQCVCKVADIKDTDVVMDLCAAPGGKTTHAGELAVNGRVFCGDLTPKKVDRINENLDRLKLNNCEARAWDATVFMPEFENKADVVLLDAPCSGLGVISRKPDIKYHVTQEGLESICKLQKEIIDCAIRYVKPGGTLLYSTCTIRKEENEQMVQYICDNYDFSLEDISELMPSNIKRESLKDGYFQFFTGEFNTDGFFLAKLKRNS